MIDPIQQATQKPNATLFKHRKFNDNFLDNAITIEFLNHAAIK